MKPLPTLRQLTYLVALAEHRHFGRAAEASFVTQSTLSASLQELETLLGATLVERTKRRVMVTPLGEEVVRRARTLLQGADDLVDAVRAAAEPLSGPLRLGVIPTIGPFVLPQALPALRQAHPRMKLYLREDMTARLLDQLWSGALDAVLIALPYAAADLETEDVADDPFVLVSPHGHPLDGRTPVDPSAVDPGELILLDDGHCLRDHALAACHLSAPGSGEGFRGTSLHTVVQMVANGLGVTLLPEVALKAGILNGTDLQARPLAGEASSRRIGLAWRKSSPRGREFKALAAFLARQIGGSSNVGAA